MQRRPKIGLIGCGVWGQNILRDLLALGCQVAVVDPSAQARQHAQSMGAVQTLAQLDQLPAVEGVVVATPATTHASVIEEIVQLHSGPIFCEKPLTTDLASGRRLAELAGDRLFVMHVWRYHPGVERFAQLARNGELGLVQMLRTTRTNWTSPRRDVDCIWTLAPHDLSIALEIFGELPPPRFAQAEWMNSAPVGMIGILGDEIPFVFEVSTRYADKRREVRLHCRDGIAILAHADAGQLAIVRSDNDIQQIPLLQEPPLLRELRTFLDYLDGGPSPRSNMVDALKVLGCMVELRRLAGIEPINENER